MCPTFYYIDPPSDSHLSFHLFGQRVRILPDTNVARSHSIYRRSALEIRRGRPYFRGTRLRLVSSHVSFAAHYKCQVSQDYNDIHVISEDYLMINRRNAKDMEPSLCFIPYRRIFREFAVPFQNLSRAMVPLHDAAVLLHNPSLSNGERVRFLSPQVCRPTWKGEKDAVISVMLIPWKVPSADSYVTRYRFTSKQFDAVPSLTIETCTPCRLPSGVVDISFKHPGRFLVRTKLTRQSTTYYAGSTSSSHSDVVLRLDATLQDSDSLPVMCHPTAAIIAATFDVSSTGGIIIHYFD